MIKIPSRIYKYVLDWLDAKGNDKLYVKVLFFQRLGYWPNIRSPKTLNEKIQWIKFNVHDPRYSEYADKLLVRAHISNTIGEEYLIPLLSSFNSVDEIDFNDLPESFVLKCNHGAGYNIICKNKKEMDFEDVKLRLDKWLKEDFSTKKKEYHYKHIKPVILCEKYMKDANSDELMDYKFFCFNGHVKYIQVDYDRYSNHTRNLFDSEWNPIDVSVSFPRNYTNISRPFQLEKMINLAEKLASDICFVRIDFYLINDKIFFGEMTFTPGAGFQKYSPKKYDKIFGDYLELPLFEEN